MINKSLGKIRLRDLDQEVLEALNLGNATQSSIMSLLSSYFNTQQDKVTKELLDPAVLNEIKQYSDNNNISLRKYIDGNYRNNNNPIKQSDLDPNLINKINNCVTTANAAALNYQFIDENGKVSNIETVVQELQNTKNQIDNIADINTTITNLRTEVENYTDNKVQSTITSVNNMENNINSLNDKFSNYREKETLISENDLSVSLQNKLSSLVSSISTLQASIGSISNAYSPKNVNVQIKANDKFVINTMNPFTYNIKAFVYNDNTSSKTYQQYVDSYGILEIGIKYKSPLDSTSVTDEDETYQICIYNTSDSDVYAKLLYTCSNLSEGNIASNI